MKHRSSKPHRGIRIDSIPAKGAAGLIFALGSMSILYLGVPLIRGLAPFLLLGGVGAGVLLYWWKHQTRW